MLVHIVQVIFSVFIVQKRIIKILKRNKDTVAIRISQSVILFWMDG